MYEQRTHLMLEPQKINGVTTKIHLVNYPKKSGSHKVDLEEALYCFGEVVLPEKGLGVGFMILHRVGKEVFVTSGRWKDKNVLHLESASKESGESIVLLDDLPEIPLCVWDLKIIGFERDAFVSYMLQPNIPNPEGYLQAKMMGDSV